MLALVDRMPQDSFKGEQRIGDFFEKLDLLSFMFVA